MDLEHYKQNLLSKKSNITNERQEVLKEFVDNINAERRGTKWKPVSGKSVAIQMSVFKDIHELKMFLSECKDYQNRNGSFSKRYYGGLKQQDFNCG